jgi:hypothetical protein
VQALVPVRVLERALLPDTSNSAIINHNFFCIFLLLSHSNIT